MRSIGTSARAGPSPCGQGAFVREGTYRCGGSVSVPLAFNYSFTVASHFVRPAVATAVEIGI